MSSPAVELPERTLDTVTRPVLVPENTRFELFAMPMVANPRVSGAVVCCDTSGGFPAFATKLTALPSTVIAAVPPPARVTAKRLLRTKGAAWRSFVAV